MLHVTEVTPVSLTYLILGGFVVLFSMMSLPLKERLYIGEVVLGTGFGVIMGPYCANIFDPRSWGSTLEAQNRITLEVMRVVLATGLFAIGVELPKAYLAEHVRSLLVMVVPTMAFGWLVVAGIIRVLFPALTYVSALAIAACLTPTDPVLAAAIIGGKFAVRNVPVHTRRLLSAESAANDGLAYPFLSISIYLAIESSKRVAFGKWFLVGWLYQVILGTVLGAILGLAFSYFMKTAHNKGLIDRESFVAQYLALAIFTIGVANTIGSDDLLAAFAAGSAVSWDGHFNDRTEDEVFSSVIDLVLNCACFIYIGAWLPFNAYNATELGITPWKLIVLFIAILALRRIPSILLLYKFVPDIHNWREALFCGHFGPMGVGAVFISTLAITELPEPSNPPSTQNELLAAMLHPVVSFVVLGSIIVHGLSIPAFWFGSRSVRHTVSLTRSLSRTWTSRTDAQPDWLISAHRTDDAIIASRSVEDIERTGALKGGKDMVGVGQIRDNLASGSSSPRQELSRTTSASSRTKWSRAITEDQRQRKGPEEGHVGFPDGVTDEAAGHGYAALHSASENRAVGDERNLGGEGSAEAEAAAEAPRTVHFKPSVEIRDSHDENAGQSLGQTPAMKQVQFAQ